jgi:hypothetical protein
MNDTTTRREFFHALLRRAAAGVLVVLGGVLWSRGGGGPRGGTCAGRGVCGGCVALERCRLPQAASFRNAAKGMTHGRG